MNKMLATAITFLVAGAVLGSCFNDKSAEAAPESTGEIAAITAAPTRQPTPEPTPLPTPEWTDNAGYSRWLEFGEWYSGESNALLVDLAEALERSDDVMAYGYALRLVSLNEEAEAWLATNPPDSCWAEQHRVLTSAVDHILIGIRAQAQWLYDYPYGKDRDAQTFYSEITAGRTDLSRLTDLISETTCG